MIKTEQPPTTPDSLRKSLGLGVLQTGQPSTGSETEDEEQSREVAVLTVPAIASSVVVKDNDAADDYIKARNLLYTQIEMVGNLTKEAQLLAQQTLNPRAFEAFNQCATLLRTLTQDLLGLQKSFKDIKKGDEKFDPPPAVSNTTTNSVTQNFVGSSAELAAFIANTNRELDKATVTDVTPK